jgi:tRNA A22 N-methylase
LVLAQLVPAESAFVVDVGADHGHVAAALGAVATERHPRRRGREDLPWLFTDGLRGLRDVDTAILAGMGAMTIARILERGPRPRCAVLHAQDDPPRLRRWLKENGWRIEAEALAPEAGRFAECLRVAPGVEDASGGWLDFGPRLLRGDDPWLTAHLEQLHAHRAALVAATQGHPIQALWSSQRAFLAARLEERAQAVAALRQHPEG